MRPNLVATAKPTRDIIDTQTGSLGIPGTESLEVRLAVSEEEKQAAQHLRYRVFYEEMGAKPSTDMLHARRDFDIYDPLADHLLVIDRSIGNIRDAVVGTYRMIRRPVAEQVGDFYSASEFNIDKIRHYPGEVLELGRSAVLKEFRNRPTMQLLWRGLAAYLYHHGIELMFGCASLAGDDPQQHALALSYLHHYHLAPPALRARALDNVYVNMNRMPVEDVDPKEALAHLTPLLKGYLRVGCFVGDGAFADHQFNTTDVFIVVQTQNLTDRYFDKYLGQYVG